MGVCIFNTRECLQAINIAVDQNNRRLSTKFLLENVKICLWKLSSNFRCSVCDWIDVRCACTHIPMYQKKIRWDVCYDRTSKLALRLWEQKKVNIALSEFFFSSIAMHVLFLSFTREMKLNRYIIITSKHRLYRAIIF